MKRATEGMTELDELLERLSALADEWNDGHLTIMKFTSGWKVMLGTPLLSIDGRSEVFRLPQYDTLEEALQSLST